MLDLIAQAIPKVTDWLQYGALGGLSLTTLSVVTMLLKNGKREAEKHAIIVESHRIMAQDHDHTELLVDVVRGNSEALMGVKAAVEAVGVEVERNGSRDAELRSKLEDVSKTLTRIDSRLNGKG